MMKLAITPSGQVVTRLPDSALNLNSNVIFANSGLFGNSEPAIWNIRSAGWEAPNAGQPAVTAITMFDYIELAGRATDAQRAAYLNEAGQFLPINVYTGHLFPRN